MLVVVDYEGGGHPGAVPKNFCYLTTQVYGVLIIDERFYRKLNELIRTRPLRFRQYEILKFNKMLLLMGNGT